MFNKKAAGTGVVLALVLVVVLVVIIYLAASGSLKNILGSSNSTSTPTAFSTTAVLRTSPILAGHSSNIIFTYFNPFGQALNPNVTLRMGNPSFVQVENSSKPVSMPADMSASASGEFNVTCVGSNEESTSTFSLSFQDFWQNATTSIETYPYGSTPLQILPLNVSSGFLSIIANPITIETQLTSSNAQESLGLTLGPVVYSGEPFVGASTGLITKLVLTVNNATGGIAAASVTYNTKTYDFSNGSTLVLTLTDVNLALLETGGLPIEVTASNAVSKPTQNLVGVDAYYNYEYSFSGPTIDCGQ